MSKKMNMAVRVVMFAGACAVAFCQGSIKTEVIKKTESDIEPILERATAWLWTQKNKDNPGWGNDTHTVLLALRLANLSRNDNHPSPIPLELQLSSKQMELEIVLMLWRHREMGYSAIHLAKYTLALNALCMDPRQFYGHDLIGTMQHHESLTDYDFALMTLAACNAEAHVRKRQIRRLLDIANASQYHNIDTVTMVVLALSCIVQDHRHRNLQHFVRKPSLSLAQRQRHDGSFGDLRTTSLIMQALEEIENGPVYNWNKSAALAWLSSRQKPDGSFDEDVHETAQVILGIAPRSMASIRLLECGQDEDSALHFVVPTDAGNEGSTMVESPNDNVIPSSTLGNVVTTINTTESMTDVPTMIIESQRPMVNVSYTLWVGTNETYHLTVTAPKNETFYGVMLRAAQMSPHFEFSASEWPNGHYVHTIAGYREEPMSYHYWLLYRLPCPPDLSSPPGNQLVAPGGVDDLEISQGEHYLFWYKKL